MRTSIHVFIRVHVYIYMCSICNTARAVRKFGAGLKEREMGTMDVKSLSVAGISSNVQESGGIPATYCKALEGLVYVATVLCL